jgi:hypothetical protein
VTHHTADADVDRLFAAVLKRPTDWPLYLILADALEDAGRQDESAGFRWLGRRKKRPYSPPFPGYTHKGVWYFAIKKSRGSDVASNLPKAVFFFLEGGTRGDDSPYHILRTFGDMRSALWAAARAAGAALASGKLKGVRR